MPFKPGNNANPRGAGAHRHRYSTDLLEIAREQCEPALDLAAATMNDADEKIDVRLKAASMLLDRGMGKPAQGVTAEQLTDDELRAELLRRKAIRELQEKAKADAQQRADSGSPRPVDG